MIIVLGTAVTLGHSKMQCS